MCTVKSDLHVIIWHVYVWTLDDLKIVTAQTIKEELHALLNSHCCLLHSKVDGVLCTQPFVAIDSMSPSSGLEGFSASISYRSCA